MDSNIASGQSADFVWVQVPIGSVRAALVSAELLAACITLINWLDDAGGYSESIEDADYRNLIKQAEKPTDGQ